MSAPISYNDHLGSILATVRPLEAVTVPTRDSLGLVLVEDVVSRIDLPVFDNSAMDGYALVASDLTDGPVTLPVRGDIAAGDGTTRRMGPGECWRIMTGAPVPDGADAVIPVERTDGGTEQVRIEEPVRPGASIRWRGEDLRAGDLLAPAGTRVLPHHLAAAVGAGVAQVRVRPRPRLAIVTTGDELVAAGQELGPGQIPESNGSMLRALAVAVDVEVSAVAHVRDDEDLAAVVDRLCLDADAVVTSGGVSAGAYEPVKDAYARGERAMRRRGDAATGRREPAPPAVPDDGVPDDGVRFVSVAMQPGKPQGFGLVGGVPLFALPGNPVSTLVSFLSFVQPALRVMAGRPAQEPLLRARVTAGWRSPAGRMQLARVRLCRNGSELEIAASGPSGSHILSGLAAAQAIAYVPAEVTDVQTGDVLDVRPLPGEEVPDE